MALCYDVIPSDAMLRFKTNRVDSRMFRPPGPPKIIYDSQYVLKRVSFGRKDCT